MMNKPGLGIPRLWVIAFRVFLGGVFAYSGFIKLIEPPENFIHSLSQYSVIPDTLIPLLGKTVPWFEFILGSYLVLGYAPRVSALLLGFLSIGLMFVIAASGMLFGTDTNCGCFGLNGPQLTIRQVFLLDLANAFIGIKLFFIRFFPLSLDEWLRYSANYDSSDEH